MGALYSISEAAAIAEMPPKTIRTALNKKILSPSSRRRVGRSVRYGFSIEEIVFVKLLAELPFSVSKTDKTALKQLLARGSGTVDQWRLAGADIVFSAGDLTVLFECKNIRRRITRNATMYERGKGRIASDPQIMGGEPIFRGTRIPLEHIAGLFRKGASESEIAEDFPQLTRQDLAFARLHSRLGARPGRPRKHLALLRKPRAA